MCLSFFVAAVKWPLVQGLALRSPHDNWDTLRLTPTALSAGDRGYRKWMDRLVHRRVQQHGWKCHATIAVPGNSAACLKGTECQIFKEARLADKMTFIALRVDTFIMGVMWSCYKYKHHKLSQIFTHYRPLSLMARKAKQCGQRFLGRNSVFDDK